MKKFLKIIAIAAGALIGLVIVVIVVLKLISDEQYKKWIAAAVKSATDRELVIDTLDIDLWSTLLIKASDIRFANAEWSDRPHMLTVEQFEAEVGLLAVLRGVADVRTLIDKVNVIIETDADGKSNWEFDTVRDDAGQVKTKEDRGLPLRPMIREFRISDVALTYLSSGTKVAKNAAIDSLVVTAAEQDATVELNGEYQSTPVTLSGNLGHMDDLLNAMPTPINLDAKIGNSHVDISGTWAPLLPDLMADLAVSLDVPSTKELTSLVDIELTELGQARLTAKLIADKGRYSVSELQTDLDNDHATLSIRGAIGNLSALQDIELNVEANTAALPRLVDELSVDVPTALPPNLNASARVSGSLDQLSVKDLNVEARDEGIAAQLSGVVANTLGPEGVEAAFQVKVDSLAALSKYAKLELPDLGALDVSGEVASAAKTYRLETLDAHLKGENINIQIKGGVDDLITVSGIGAHVKAQAGPFSENHIAKLKSLLRQTNVNIPLILPDSVSISAGLAGDLDQLSLKGVDAEILDEGMKIQLAGSVSDLLAPAGVDATFNATVDKLAALSKYIKAELPEHGALDLSGQVVSVDKTYRLANLDAKFEAQDVNASLAGGIDDLLESRGINAEFKADVASLSALSPLLRTELPSTNAVTITGKVAAADGDKKPQTNVVMNAKSNGAEITVDGNLADLRSMDSIHASIEINATLLSDFNKFAQTELPEQGPLSLTGTVKKRTNEYRLDDLKMTLDKQKLHGNIGIKLADSETARGSIKGQLEIPFLDLSHLIAIKPSEQSAEAKEATTKSEPKPRELTGKRQDGLEEVEEEEERVAERLFSTDPLPVDVLRDYDADVLLNADRLRIGKVNATSVEIKLSLQEGLLRIDPIKAIAGSGILAGEIEIDASVTPPKLSVDIVSKEAPMPRFGGELDLNVDVDSAGESMADLMGGLNGQVLIVMRDALLERSALTEFGRGLLSQLNPFAEEKKRVKMECGILRVDITDGKADFQRKLAAQLTEITWRGGGDINLKTEKLDIGVVPIPRAGFSLSVGSLASLVRVGGTLKNPSMELNPTDVAVKYGKYMAALSTGGLSFLANTLLNMQKANEDVCARILDGTVFEKKVPEKEPATEKKTDTSVPISEGESVPEKATAEPEAGTEKPIKTQKKKRTGITTKN